MKIAQYALIAMLFYCIFCNLKISTAIINRGQKFLDSSDEFPGTPFLFLKPSLTHVYHAGYYADHTPANPDIDPNYARNFQTAGFALAPTFLDHENPWKYSFVIVHLSHPEALANILKQWPSRVMSSNGSNIFLLQQIKS